MKSKVKILTILLLFITTITIFTGCANDEDEGNNASPSPQPTQSTDATPTEATTDQTTPTEAATDAITTASIVDNEADFEKAIGTNGTWIIATLNDLTFDKDLVLEGEYKNGKKNDNGQDVIQRKIALYTQDESRTVTARFTLTAPKMTITSPEASIQHGTFKGDLYVDVSNFKLVDATVDGNIYFASEDAKSTFTMDENSSVTGKQELADDKK